MEEKSDNFNYLLDTNGARICERSSEKKGCSAENVLNSNERKLWLSDPGLPQELTVDISELVDRPIYFKCFAWYCWQAYNSNPSVLELWASKSPGKWEKWGSFKGSLKGGIIYFDISPLSREYLYLKIVVRDTFGASNTYINQIYLFDSNPQDLNQHFIEDGEAIQEGNMFFINSSQPAEEFFDPDVDLKDRLKSQLDELQEEVKSICSDRADSPKSVPSQFVSPISKYFSPKINEKRPDLMKLKKEVAGWSQCIKDMQKNIKKLTMQVSALEDSVSNKDIFSELKSFKEEIIQEIKMMDFGASSYRESEKGMEGIDEVVKEMLRNWEEKVYRPQINAALKAAEKNSGAKEDPQEIMKKLKEKIALKAELERKKNLIGEESDERRNKWPGLKYN